MAKHLPAGGRNDYIRFLLIALPALTLTGYFVVPGWLTAGLLLLYLVTLPLLLRPALRTRLAALLRLAQVRWMVVALAAPLVAVTVVEIGHGELVWRRFEGPGRLFVASSVLLVLAACRIDFSRSAGWAFPTALALCAAWVFQPGAETYYWGNRAATAFMDPITLSSHAVVFGFACAILMERSAAQSKLTRVALALAVLLAMMVAIRTHSRTGWAIVPVLAVLLACHHARRHRGRLPLLLVLIAAALAASYLLLPSVQMRVQEAVQELRGYFDGGSRDTSLGVRLSLFRTNLILFGERPWLGWGYTAVPDILSIPSIREIYTPLFGYYWSGAGGHNEYLQSMMRMGVVGLASRLLVILVPLGVFACAARSADPARARNGLLGLVVVIAYLSTGLTQEVFNLSYSASLYALLVSIFAAGAIPQPAPRTVADVAARDHAGAPVGAR